jgi:hypothetical protein
MDNFNRPFLATNLNAAWASWHISLTTWIGDYVLPALDPQVTAEGVDHHHLHLRAHRFLARAHMELRDVRPLPWGGHGAAAHVHPDQTAAAIQRFRPDESRSGPCGTAP